MASEDALKLRLENFVADVTEMIDDIFEIIDRRSQHEIAGPCV